jgi:predicted CXXCH cytochrome family protein
LPHHAVVKPDDEPSCASCHREHQGAAASIVRASDTQCLTCHRDLASHRVQSEGTLLTYGNVTGFAPPSETTKAHPEFRSLARDPGNIKFHHWLHLQPGIAGSQARQKMRLADLPDEARRNYARSSGDGDLVQLDCAACHEPEDEGRHMRPIAYEQHCRACHPLTTAITEDEKADVPHGLARAQLEPVLDGLLLASELRNAEVTPPSPSESADLPLIPGKTLGSNLAQKIQRDLLGKRATFAAAVSAKCSQCHTSRMASDDALLPDLPPANIPNPWFQHARFDHGSHRHVECRTCHRQAHQSTMSAGVAANEPYRARDDEVVMIAGLEVCATCHGPKRGETGGARHDCAECHAYHGRDRVGPSGPTGPESQVDVLLKASTIRQVSLNAATPLVGAGGCASANCHGSADASAAVWQKSFTTWVARDPHAQAYSVLLSYRSREMTRQLAGREVGLGETEHLQALQDRCTNCHAMTSESTTSANLGVQCESCHGPAGFWLPTHHYHTFSREMPGFIDTKDLATRVKACLKCHGNGDADSPHVVNHDLIAAGHPRLTFDFRTYVQSLPAHWDRQTDEARYSPAFHFQSWLTGITQSRALAFNSLRSDPPDFAALDCFACHHQLTAANWRQPARLSNLKPPDWPPNDIFMAEVEASAASYMALTRRVLEAAASQPRFDAAIDALHSVQALRADMTQSTPETTALDAAIGSLRRYLAVECFDRRLPSAYDSPSQFSPEGLAPHLAAVLRTLENLQPPSR